jgi:hypothetical protein
MRHVTALDVACPACGESPGRRCQKLGSSRATSPHPQRLRRAHEEDLRLNPEHVYGQLGLFPAKDARP